MNTLIRLVLSLLVAQCVMAKFSKLLSLFILDMHM